MNCMVKKYPWSGHGELDGQEVHMETGIYMLASGAFLILWMEQLCQHTAFGTSAIQRDGRH